MRLVGLIIVRADAAEAERLVKAFVDDKTNVISRLKMATPLQVNLHVKFAEVNRSLVRQIGSNLTTIDGSGGFKFGVGQGRAIGQTINTDPNLPLGIGTKVQGYTLDPTTGKVALTDGTVVTPLSGAQTIAGMGRLFGIDGLMQFAKSAVKFLVTGLIDQLAVDGRVVMLSSTAHGMADRKSVV